MTPLAYPIAKKVYTWNGTTWVLAKHTLFLHDGWHMIAELDALAANAVTRTYVWGLDLSGSLQGAGGVGGLLFTNFHLPSANSHAPAYDGNGNVIALVDMATGVQSGTYDYNAFGETTVIDGAAAVLNPYRFSTKYTDVETELLYYGFRYYQSQIGRWLSRDAINEQGGMNLYGLTGNNPINTLDYLGLYIKTYNYPGHVDEVTNEPLSDKVYEEAEATYKLEYSSRVEASGDMWEVILDGRYKPKIRYRSEAQKKDPELRKHEMRHVEINAEEWNRHADRANEYERRYCSEQCAKLAIPIVRAIREFSMATAYQRNVDFDWDEYGRSSHLPSVKERLTNQETEANVMKARAEVALTKALIDFEAEGCK